MACVIKYVIFLAMYIARLGHISQDSMGIDCLAEWDVFHPRCIPLWREIPVCDIESLMSCIGCRAPTVELSIRELAMKLGVNVLRCFHGFVECGRSCARDRDALPNELVASWLDTFRKISIAFWSLRTSSTHEGFSNMGGRAIPHTMPCTVYTFSSLALSFTPLASPGRTDGMSISRQVGGCSMLTISSRRFQSAGCQLVHELYVTTCF